MKALVTGGGGFLGGVIVRMLRARGDDVTVFGRNRYPAVEALGARSVVGDVRDADAVMRACAKRDTVFHVAAIPGIWGPRRMYFEINYEGTRNVLAACRACGVRRLVYTSSPSVVLSDGPISGANESLPYPSRYLTAYPESKAAAERAVLTANDSKLQTVALRPHLIVGPGDPHLMPRILERARRRRLVQVGDGRNRVDLTDVDDAARAHLLAADELGRGARCAGRAYFLSQGEPVVLWTWLADVLARVGAPPITRRLSHRAARALGVACEGVYAALRLRGEPPMTRFLADQLALDHFFDISAARRDFGYAPGIRMSETTARVVASLAPPTDAA
ncbi:MAG: NAD-dependent epimerase/dehydratase family protein [Phycisphaerae bacterium]|nr:MAG: NAD-dependent epimerase/dehydratase family protein [Planctomycetota bacterium]KAB2947034.1 MAG: NAD-dependent epimerase/dehydratase family protein [Phycisphaerae bacterium]MBE7456865.1 NAD-dependent epimerase/dehydratase family protein [Planctomycetia bacterium]MCK6464312.1 NAD-dependent epimerase/dehydratase family protein [Phycisphaerae bacterium]MCL4717905.1 NAD-dependent epimerase/dehydratase family protein [Phycisphaerae bacterium]